MTMFKSGALRKALMAGVAALSVGAMTAAATDVAQARGFGGGGAPMFHGGGFHGGGFHGGFGGFRGGYGGFHRGFAGFHGGGWGYGAAGAVLGLGLGYGLATANPYGYCGYGYPYGSYGAACPGYTYAY